MIPSPMSAVQLMGSLTDYKSSQSREGIAGVSKNIHGSDIGSSEPERKVLEDKARTAAEISIHKSDEDAWIVVDGLVYDITCFLQTHPGGAETILTHLHDKDVGKLMRGELDSLPDSHPHSKYAFRMLQQFLVGRVSDYLSEEEERQTMSSSSRSSNKSHFTVDLTKPLVFQVGQLGADYDKWVHDPIVQKEPPRFFQSNLAEFFTQTSWWMIPLVWSPVALWCVMLALQQGLWSSVLPLFMACGAFIWTLIEYVLHRYVFHMKTSGYWTNTLHYFLHGFHHKHPMDGTRLVFPPAVTAIIVYFIWVVTEPLVLIVGRPVKLAMFSGGVVMYIAYDLTHYYLHFGVSFSEASRRMKRFHLNHHFKDQTNSYGITTTIWDWVFQTLPTQASKLLWTQ